MCGITAVVTLARHQRTEPIDDPSRRPTDTNCDSSAEGNTSQARKERLAQQLTDSLGAIKHRGPDSQGQWVSNDGLIGTSPEDAPTVMRH